jgi:hypothetical protein
MFIMMEHLSICVFSVIELLIFAMQWKSMLIIVSLVSGSVVVVHNIGHLDFHIFSTPRSLCGHMKVVV